jgi:hypothetical protein
MLPHPSGAPLRLGRAAGSDRRGPAAGQEGRVKAVGFITTTLVLIVYSSVLNGWTLSKLWSWFIVRQFEVRPLSVPAAIGVALVVKFLTVELNSKDKSEKSFLESIGIGAAMVTIKVFVMLGLGAIVKMFL